jgi:outer membrane protein
MPILGQFQTNKSIALARNNVLIARNEAADTEKRLVEHIYEIYAEIETARNKYKYSVSSAERGKTALEYSAEKLANGMITVSDYMIEKENLLIAEAQASKAKYEYWFKMYLLRFYYTI